MKLKKFNLTISSLVFTLGMSHAYADFSSDAEILLNWGEKNYSQILTTHETTKVLPPWYYRYYPVANVYVGLNSQDNGIYVLNGAPGAVPVLFGNVPDFLKQINSTNSTYCDQNLAPEGFSFQQVGNVIKVSTNGQCPRLTARPVCTPSANEPGVSVLSSTDIRNFTLDGISFTNPAIGSLVQPAIQKAGKTNTCIINAPKSLLTQTIDMDVCVDVSDKLSDFSNLSSFFIAKPPITMKIQGGVVNLPTDDCFKTDSTYIINALTKESWNNVNGVFIKN